MSNGVDTTKIIVMNLNLLSKSSVFLTRQEELDLALKKCTEYSFGLCNTKKSDIIIYDSFDGRLISKNILLFRSGEIFYLLNPRNKKYIFFEFNHPSAVFKISDLKDEKIKKALSPASVRALMPLLLMSGVIDVYNLKNNDKKTIARCTICRLNSDSFTFLVVTPLKGFKDETDEFVNLLKSFGLNLSRGNIVSELLNKYPELYITYSNKIQTVLNQNDLSDKAVSVIVAELLKKAKTNLNGILHDYDTEFLHDYRVSLRKARSILSGVGDVFDKEKAKYFRGIFKTFAQITNKLRDIDVYLLRIPEFREELPQYLNYGLDDIENYLLKLRESESKKVNDFLQSPEFKADFGEAVGFFQKGYVDYPGELAGKNIYNVAAEAINDRLASPVKRVKKSKSMTPETLHKLRIDFKELRYLIEAFGNVVYGEKTEALLNKLKRFQDEIGLYHDYHNHIIMLNYILNEMSVKNDNTEKTVKQLEKIFAKKRDKLEKKVLERLDKFLQKKNISKYRPRGSK
ncbi:MAG: CHAD domain-containing protein [Flexistipes sinusarabici]|uniref:CHAD domain-containing protein n=1 Tax=Flexistipes sinusarabici TaxID=2352 RepID=A0A5D0MR15_FLESI|nr:CHAD domain-containing protein [Flexistipes sinusarabici]TYB33269.1 MAG: CHAD domain-containing protein [Flexistipes sinusarabici]